MQRKFYRLNQQIQAPEIRLLDYKGIQIGIFSKEEALKQAFEQGVDLVEVAPNAKPPVCKLIDFKKFLYQEEKRKKEEKKSTKSSEIKEIRLGPFTSEHDLQVKVTRAREFLKDGHRLKLVIKFAGRQMTHPEFGHKITNLFLESIHGISKVDREAHFEGRLLITTVAPVKQGAKKEGVVHEKNEDKKVNSQTV